MYLVLCLVIAVFVGGSLCKWWVHSRKVGNFREKYVFVTGCDSGFGRQFIDRLDVLGFHVFAGCLTKKGVTEIKDSCSERVIPLQLDVTSEENIAEAVTFVKKHLLQDKGIWAVVNNAGVMGPFVSPELWHKLDYMEVLSVNLFGPIEVNKAFLPLVRKGQGRLVIVTSIAGRYPMAVGPYSVSKTALQAYVSILRREMYSQGIAVVMIEPGAHNTSFTDRVVESSQRAYDKANDEVKKYYPSEYSGLRTIMNIFPTNLEQVVDSYVRAVTDKYPKTRYVVGIDAKYIFIPISFLPDRLADLIMIIFEKLGRMLVDFGFVK